MILQMKNIGKHISESMNAGPYDHYQYLNGNYVFHYSLLLAVSSADVEEIILPLRNKPSNINTFSTYVLKRIRSTFFTFFVNLSLYLLVFFPIV